MANVGDIRAFVDASGRAIYGQVIAERDGDVALIDTDGCFYWADKTYGLGEKLPDGTALIGSSKVAAEVHAATNDLLNDPLAKSIAKRIARISPRLIEGGEPGSTVTFVTKLDTGKVESRATKYQSWDAVPLRMFTGRQLDDAGKPRMTHEMERYLFESDERRNREATLLSILEERAPTQHKAVLSVFYGGLSQARASELLKLNRGNFSRQYRKGMEWLSAGMGWNVSGV